MPTKELDRRTLRILGSTNLIVDASGSYEILASDYDASYFVVREIRLMYQKKGGGLIYLDDLNDYIRIEIYAYRYEGSDTYKQTPISDPKRTIEITPDGNNFHLFPQERGGGSNRIRHLLVCQGPFSAVGLHFRYNNRLKGVIHGMSPWMVPLVVVEIPEGGMP